VTVGLVRPLAILGVAVPSAILVLSFAIVCVHWNSAWPWDLAVHEDGRRTLLDTLFFFEHATRELPGDLLLAAAAGAAVYFALPTPRPPRPRFDGRDRALAGIAVLLVALFVGAAVLQVGAPMVVENLLQHHTRPGAPLIWGSHWRYHLLERLPMILSAVALGGAVRALAGRTGDRAGRAGGAACVALVALYLALTAVFTRSLGDLALPFLDPRYLGHQAREIVTHATMTLPLALGGAVLLQGPFEPAPRPAPVRVRAFGWPVALMAVALAMAGYALLAALSSGATSQGQTDDMVSLVFVHFFEHALGYLTAPFAAAAAYGACRAFAADDAARRM
jgi:hypothetical protein